LSHDPVLNAANGPCHAAATLSVFFIWTSIKTGHSWSLKLNQRLRTINTKIYSGRSADIDRGWSWPRKRKQYYFLRLKTTTGRSTGGVLILRLNQRSTETHRLLNENPGNSRLYSRHHQNGKKITSLSFLKKKPSTDILLFWFSRHYTEHKFNVFIITFIGVFLPWAWYDKKYQPGKVESSPWNLRKPLREQEWKSPSFANQFILRFLPILTWFILFQPKRAGRKKKIGGMTT